MKVSLIMPTINVTTELDLFLKSLKAQTYKNFELIVVDQNEGYDVFEIVKLRDFLMMIANISQTLLKKLSHFLREKKIIKFIPAARLNVERLTEQALWKKEIWI